jgi:hypothetical protein
MKFTTKDDISGINFLGLASKRQREVNDPNELTLTD